MRSFSRMAMTTEQCTKWSPEERMPRKTIDQMAADRLAYHVAKLVMNRTIDARCPAADALLDYLRIGSGGPLSVPDWMEKYEAEQKR